MFASERYGAMTLSYLAENGANTNVSSAEWLLGAGKRLQIEGRAGVGRGEREERGGRTRMYPQCSRRVSNMALVLCKKKRETEQINSDHQIPPTSPQTPPLPTRIKAEGGCRWSCANTYGLCARGAGTVAREGLEQILLDIFNFLIMGIAMR